MYTPAEVSMFIIIIAQVPIYAHLLIKTFAFHRWDCCPNRGREEREELRNYLDGGDRLTDKLKNDN